LLLLVGLDPVELIRKPWPYAAPVVDICAFAHDPHYLTPAARVVGDLPTTLTALAATLTPGDWTGAEIEAHREGFLAGMTMPPSEGLAADSVVTAAVAAFTATGAKPRLTVDAGAHMFSACAFWQAEIALDVLISNGLASMGFSLPAAIAAALPDPDRGAVAMTGAGGRLTCPGELKTAADTGAAACAAVFSAAQEAASASGPRLIDARVDPSGYLPQMKALRG